MADEGSEAADARSAAALRSSAVEDSSTTINNDPGTVSNTEDKELQEEAEAEAAFLRQCKEVYQLFDRGTGFLLSKDLGSALRALGQIPSEHEIDSIVSRLEQEDLYSRGHTKLSFEDFYRVVQENSERTTDIREMVLDSFRTMDPSNTGKVSAAKLTSLLTSLGEALSAPDMRELLQDAEVDKDGDVDYIKFVEDVLALEVATSNTEATAKEAKLPDSASSTSTKK